MSNSVTNLPAGHAPPATPPARGARRALRSASPLILVIALTALFHGLLASAGPASTGNFSDADGYMRAVRVDELLTSGNWFDTVIDRNNAPFGDELHWTRPLDVVIALGTLTLDVALEREDALFWAAALSSPLFHLVAIAAVAWTAAQFGGRRAGMLAAIALLLQPLIWSYSMAGRADHHTLQMLLTALTLGFSARLIRNPASTRDARWLGLVAGFGVWVAPEQLLALVPVIMILAARWVLRGVAHARAGMQLAAAFLVTLVVAIGIERHPSAWLDIEYDRISLAHVAAAALMTAVWGGLLIAATHRHGMLESTPRRLFALAGAGAAAGGVLLAVAPDFVRGPLASVDSRLVPVWLDFVNEMQPYVPTNITDFGYWAIDLGALLVALPFVAYRAWRADGDQRWMWIMGTVAVAMYGALALSAVRFGVFAGVVIAIALGAMASDMRRAIRLRVHRRQLAILASAIATAAIFTAIPVAGGALAAATEADPRAANPDPDAPPVVICDPTDAISGMEHAAASLGEPGDLVVAAHLDFGPEIMWRTDFQVLAGPYHRNTDGILASLAILGDDPEHAEATARERGVSLVLVCVPSTPIVDTGIHRMYGPRSLASLVAKGEVPDWLREVAPTDTAYGFRLFAVEGTDVATAMQP